MRIINILTIIISLILFCACSSKSGNQFLEKLSTEEISTKIIKGETTKSQIQNLYGKPYDIDLLAEGKETWLYIFTKSTAKGVNYIPYVNLAYSGTNDITKKLKILFNSSGIVEFFSLTDSKGETKVGLFQ
jgi:outer membrane protein assembly factor BamE (lipoprotein component of BamABCDE complex)